MKPLLEGRKKTYLAQHCGPLHQTFSPPLRLKYREARVFAVTAIGLILGYLYIGTINRVLRGL